MTKVRYEIEVDRDMFPFAPGSEVVVRNLARLHQPDSVWQKAIFVCREAGDTYHCMVKDREAIYLESYTFCHPLATHGHLVGTTYPADAPKCSLIPCGKAAPNNSDGTPRFHMNGYILCKECAAKIAEFRTAYQGRNDRYAAELTTALHGSEDDVVACTICQRRPAYLRKIDGHPVCEQCFKESEWKKKEVKPEDSPTDDNHAATIKALEKERGISRRRIKRLEECVSILKVTLWILGITAAITLFTNIESIIP